jgi:hypothetical protein
MCLDDIIGDTESEPGAFRSFFGGKKWLQDFFFDVIRYARSVVPDCNRDGFTFFV